MEKSYNIKDFIGVFDNFIPPKECDDLIKMYDDNETIK